MNKKEYNQYLVTGVEDGWIEVGRDTWNNYLEAKKELSMNKKKYKIDIPVGWIIGYLRYGHFEGTVELTDEELEEIKNGSMTPKEVACEYDLDLIVDDYRVEDCGGLEDPIIEEVRDV